MKKNQWLLFGITAAFICILIGIFIGRNHLGGQNLNIQSGQTPSLPVTEPLKPVGDGRININTATVEQLDLLDGIGTAIAQRIIDYRTEHGPFAEIEDIMKVSGIGAKKFVQIKDYIKVGDSNEDSGS